jgi:hypothetical protein
MSIRAEDISGSDDGKASERRELARTPSFSAKICLKTSFSDTKNTGMPGICADSGVFY